MLGNSTAVDRTNEAAFRSTSPMDLFLRSFRKDDRKLGLGTKYDVSKLNEDMNTARCRKRFHVDLAHDEMRKGKNDNRQGAQIIGVNCVVGHGIRSRKGADLHAWAVVTAAATQ